MSFSFWDAVRRSGHHLSNRWPQFFRLSWFWMLFGLVGFFAQELTPARPIQEWQAIDVAAIVGQLVGGVLFAVAWHRTTLVDEHLAGWLPLRFSRLEGAYLWRSLKIGVLAALVPCPLWFLMPLAERLGGGYIALVLLAYGVTMLTLMTRWSLALPAAAVARPMSLTESWRRSRGQGWKLFAGPLLLVLPLQVGALLVAMAGVGLAGAIGLRLTGIMVAGSFLQVAQYASVALATGFLSYAYQDLVPDGGAPSPSAS